MGYRFAWPDFKIELSIGLYRMPSRSSEWPKYPKYITAHTDPHFK